MSTLAEQRANKPAIEELAREKLDGTLLKEFEEFLGFLKDEQCKFKWCAFNKYNANYRSKGIAVIGLGDNKVRIEVYTANRDNLDDYLDGQSDEIASLLIERIKNGKCRQCRPTCGCSRGPGFTFQVSDSQYQNICHGAIGYAFVSSGSNMQTMTLFAPGADRPGPPPVVRQVPIETIKNLILGKKKFEIKLLAKN